MVCHIHPGTNMVTTYFGYTWWDNETDGEHDVSRQATQSQRSRSNTRFRRATPNAPPSRGLWSDPDFLEKTGTPEFNRQLQHTQFADFHCHGWIFRAVFKHDRKGNLLDEDDRKVSSDDPDKFGKAVHLKDIHLEKGMHCIDCHFEQDSHGNGKLYGETRNAIEIDCVDCHGTIRAARHADHLGHGRAERRHRTWRAAHAVAGAPFLLERRPLFQRSMLEKDKEWEVVQVLDTITPGSAALQREIAPCQNDSAGWSNLGRRAGKGFAR